MGRARDAVRHARRVASPAASRLRRELQWRRARVGRLLVGDGRAQPCRVAEHATPLFRPLAGLDEELQRGKVVNLRLAAARLDGLVLPPGAVFSFWRHVGRPSRSRGFVDGLVLDHGSLSAGVGGGMCQLTNLLYWMTLHTPLEVTERWRHSYDVFPDAGRTQPFGSGATCSWPTLDLQVSNPTAATFRLEVGVTDTHLEGRWTSDRPVGLRYEVYEAAHVMEPTVTGAFVRRNVLRRRVFDLDGAQVADEPVAENHALMRYRPFLPSGGA
ncbi:VanW family protein [Isoptericola sp. b490]|uniref:VanW family protein n=1 Tax=Actinotalea lenta TaxID=3064654 RepID=UPI0027130F70|nr:VanW family protein [Isoptericola sp. b490]MDO8120035.1 VanW family protein [Isoptericola sp. b490]